MATETHRVHTDIQKLPFLFVQSRHESYQVKVIFHDLLTLLITFILKKKKKIKRKADVKGGRNKLDTSCFYFSYCLKFVYSFITLETKLCTDLLYKWFPNYEQSGMSSF